MSTKWITPAVGRASMGLGGALFAAIAIVANTGNASVTEKSRAVEAADAAPGTTLHDVVNRRMSLAESNIVRLETEPTPGVAKSTVIELGGELMTLNLAPHSVRSDNFRMYRSDANGDLTEIAPIPERTYRGVVVGDAGSLVTATVDDDGLHARVMMGDTTEYWVEPVAPQFRDFGDAGEALAGLHVVYHAEDVVHDHDHLCGTPANLATETIERTNAAGGGETAQSSGGNFICEIAFDVDSFYLAQWGETIATNRISQIVNSGLNVMYPRDVQVEYEITAFIFRESQVYTAGTIDGVLNQFRNRWIANHSDIVRDVAELFIGRDLSGSVIGIAYFAGICNTNGYSVVEDLGGFTCRIDLSAHELGHNWNSDHCSCPSNTMNAGLTCTRVFHPTFSIPEIVTFRNSRTCLDSPPPPPPANDDCGSAQAVGDGIVAFDSEGATTDGPDLPGSCDEGGGLSFVQDVWFDYTAPCSGTVTANTCISGTFDTRIAVYDGSGCFGALLACNDDACGPGGVQSQTTFSAVSGQRYRVRVGGNNTGGTGILSMQCVPGVACPEDLDMSGSVDFGDILAILGAWGNAGGPEDLDMSGFVDFGDLLEILGAWGPCP